MRRRYNEYNDPGFWAMLGDPRRAAQINPPPAPPKQQGPAQLAALYDRAADARRDVWNIADEFDCAAQVMPLGNQWAVILEVK